MSALAFVLALLSLPEPATCEDFAAGQYTLAERFGSERPDAVYEAALLECERDARELACENDPIECSEGS